MAQIRDQTTISGATLAGGTPSTMWIPIEPNTGTVTNKIAATELAIYVAGTIANATTSVAGFMSAADKTKLNLLTVTSAASIDTLVSQSHAAVTAANASISLTGQSVGVALDSGANNLISLAGGGLRVDVPSGHVTYAKIQNVSATDKLLGRSTAGAGSVEEITCTAFARTLLDDVDAAAWRSTLGLGSVATLSSIAYSNVQNVSATSRLLGRATSGAGVIEEITIGSGLSLTGTTLSVSGGGGGSYTFSATDKLYGRVSSGGGAGEEIDCTAYARTILDDADATAARTTLGLGSLATQSGTFSGTSSGTNTGDQTITLTGNVTGSGTGSFAATIANDAVTYAKMQNVSATDRILGRATAGAGDVEEITCTSFGRSLIDDADASAARTTLGLGTSATQDSSTYATASHSHAASDVTSGTIATARLGSGTASSSTYLRGDQTWATVSGGVSDGTYGQIVVTGTGATWNLASTATPTITSLTTATGTITSSTPAISVTQTWNSSGVTFVAANIAITSTASAAASKVLNASVGGTDVFYVDKSGVSYANTYQFINGAKLESSDSANIGFNLAGTQMCRVTTNSINITSGMFLGSGTTTTSPDTVWRRESSGQWSTRNGANATAILVWNTYSSATSYERAVLDWQTTSNVFRVGTEKGSGGGTARTMAIVTDATTRVTYGASGGETWSEGHNVTAGTTTGSKIGTATGEKIGFWNATPVVQQVLATGASRTVDDVIAFLQTIGLCKQS